MDWEVLIPILFFALPVAISILDKRARKRKGVPSVQARPVIDPAAENPADFQPVGEVAPENRSHLPTRPEAPSDEGQRAIHRDEKKKAQEDGQKKLEIDKKKLILYSEILKPKFDA